MIESIESEGELLALIVRNSFRADGLTFVTPEKSTFQVGIHNVSQGKRYRAHTALPFENIGTLEPNKIYYVKRGKIGVDLYNLKNEKSKYVTLADGDLILFMKGGHGVDIMEDAEIVEIKQGPYRGVEKDKHFLE